MNRPSFEEVWRPRKNKCGNLTEGRGERAFVLMAVCDVSVSSCVSYYGVQRGARTNAANHVTHKQSSNITINLNKTNLKKYTHYAWACIYSVYCRYMHMWTVPASGGSRGILRLKVRSHTKRCAIARTPVVPGYPATSNFNQLTIVNKYA